MKAQDVIVLLKMAMSADGESRTYAEMAKSLKISAAEIHAATKRAADAGLLSIVSPRERKVNREKFLRWLEESVATNFPAKYGPLGLGLPTGLTAVHLPEIQTYANDLPFVWPSPEGTARGKTVKPLYKTAPSAALGDRSLHEGLALVDLLRIGTAREKDVAIQELGRRITPMKRIGSPFDIRDHEIDDWSRCPDAPLLLPNLIRRIILDLEPVRRIHFAGDKAVFHSAFDGELVTAGPTRFANHAQSFWEISARQDAAQKIRSDFKKRELSGGSASTLVFLTAKQLPPQQRQAILTQLKQNSNWGEIRVYDATDLAQWLAIATSAAVWFREQLGTETIGLETADAFLDLWRYAARVDPGVAGLGRKAEREKLLTWLQSPSAGVLHIRAETVEECVLFAVSAIASSIEHAESWGPRIIIVRQEHAWKCLLQRLKPNPARPLLLIPRFPEFDGIANEATGHFVLMPSEPGTAVQRADIYLRPSPREELEEFLLQTKFKGDKAKAQQVARDSGGKLSALVWLVGGNFPRVPSWLASDHFLHKAPIICGLLLAGAWDPRNENDKGALRNLCDATDDEVEREVNFLLGQTSDPPLREQGYALKWRSPADAWRLLSPHLTAAQLDRFQGTCVKILSLTSPKYERPADERIYAGVRGLNDPCSDSLRKALADSLAWLRVNKGRMASSHGRDKIEPLILACLTAILTPDWKRWATLGTSLTALAEASPETFMSCLKMATGDSKQSFTPLFEQQGRNSVFPEFTTSGLLWALQTIAWYDVDFWGLVKLLVDLSKLDTAPSRSSHTPFSVLAEYFHPQAKRCAASNESRIAALRGLREDYADIAWKLLAALAKSLSHGGFIMQNQRPRFASLDRLPQDFEEFSPQEAGAFFHAAVDLTRKMLDEAPDRVGDILDARAALPLALDCIEQQADYFRRKPDLEVRKIQDQLRMYLRFPPDRADEGKLRKRIEKVIASLDPQDLLLANAWLFSRRARLGLEDFKTEFSILDARWERKRLEIIASIPAGDNIIDKLLVLARAAPEPALVGETVAQSAVAEEIERDVWLGPLLGTGPDLGFAEGFVITRYNAKGRPWLLDCLNRLLIEGRTDVALRLAQTAPSTADIRDWVETEMPGEVDEYWKQRRYVRAADLRDQADFRRCIQKFVNAGNWDAALDLVGFATSGHGSKGEDRYVDAETVIQLLENVLESLGSDPGAGQRLAAQSWHLDSIFKWLNHHMAAELEQRLIRLEINFFGLLQDEDARLLIFQKMAREPAFFVKLMEQTYCRASAVNDERTPTEQEKNAASVAWRINQAWGGYPGDDAASPAERDAVLKRWCEDVLKLTRENDRAVVGESKVGEVLARAPPHDDGIWPCSVAREFLRKGSVHLRRGLWTGKINSRGVVVRSMTAGGALERDLATRYRADAERLRLEWPETAKLLDDMAKECDYIAVHEDKESEGFE